MCVRHLIQQGHRRIGIISGSSSLQTGRERLQGYIAALNEADIDMDAELIKEGDFRQTSGYRLGKDLLFANRRPTAVFVANGLMAIGFVQALNEAYLSCPEDIAVACFDDLPLSDIFQPQITAVIQPAYEIGRVGAQLLIDRLQQNVSAPTSPVSICLSPELKIRSSTSRRLDRDNRRPLMSASSAKDRSRKRALSPK
jgi:LacI family transcriptional regulator